MSELARFQDDFLAALFRLSPDGEPSGLAVYRNTVWRGLIDALQAAYPAVARITGPEWFEACAAVYVRAHPPADPLLALYGADFPDFLRTFPPASELPYLSEVAAGERLWIEAHLAADAPPFEPFGPDAPSGDALLDRPLRLHPAVRFQAFPVPVGTLLRLNRDADTHDGAFGDIIWRPEIVGVFRPGGAVTIQILDESQHVLLKACRQGRPLGEALLAAIDAGADASAGLSELVALGAFAAAEPDPTPDPIRRKETCA
ncbi:MAG: DNA-binding domain-containing protein [Phenylobacterium sp.]|nr:DNA-binding domain-containing protein [Phenylobacterium sp.]